jgi:NAD(P)-dependent dehydrogenase (short-subunit alcohol dehydrogenase family)
MKSLEGRVAIVTGAAHGLGRSHALLLAAEGARVLVNDVKDAQSVVDEIVAAGGDAIAHEVSVASMDAGRELVAAAVEAFGDLHVVVNNAGILRDGVIINLSEQDFDDVIAIHLKGTFSLTQAAARRWREQSKAGADVDRAIVNTSSATGLHGNAGQVNYAAAKAGIAMMTVCSAFELKRYGVRANCIAPAARTSMVMTAPQLVDIVGEPDDPAVFDKYNTDNVSPLVAYLAASGCRYNGQVWSVMGGHVGLYAGWSIGTEIDAGRRWTVAELTEQLADWPRRITVNRQVMEPAG